MKSIKFTALNLLALFCLATTTTSCTALGGDFWTALSQSYQANGNTLFSSYRRTAAAQQTNQSTLLNTIKPGNGYSNTNVGLHSIKVGSVPAPSYSQTYNDTYTTQPSTTTSSSSTTKVKHTCTTCNGTGRVKRNVPSTSFGIDTSKERCPECGEMMARSGGHTHTICTSCNGKGYWQ